MSEFGDHTDDDSIDTEPPDAEQVARKLQALRNEAPLEDLTSAQRVFVIAVAQDLIDWLRRQGAIRP